MEHFETFSRFYLTDTKDGIKQEKEVYKNLDIFLSKFPPSSLSSISKDDYCIGKGDNNSFCYWVERRLRPIGSILGATSDKFGLYWSNKYKKFIPTKKYGKDEDECIGKIRNELQMIVDAARVNDIYKVSTSNFGYMFRHKVYYLYQKEDRDIPVFDKDHIDAIIKYFDLNIQSSSNTEAEKRIALFNLKNNNPVFSKGSNRMFMSFLYSPFFGLPLKKKETEQDSVDAPKMPIEQFTGNYNVEGNQNNHSILTKQNRVIIARKINYEKLNQKKKTLGTFGELLILNDEATRLKNIGIDKKPIHSSMEMGDGLGYDIVSYDKEENEIFIEVKTTNTNQEDNFYMTDRELKVARELGDRYFIYRVYHIDKSHGKYCVRVYRKNDIENLFNCEPTQYKMVFKQDKDEKD